VEIKGSTEEASWDHYIQRHPAANGSHLIAWRRVVEEAFGHRTFYLMARNEQGEVKGVLPLVFLSSRFFGRLLASMPFLTYGGIIADSSEARVALLASAVDLARGLGASHIELRQQELQELKWQYKQHKVSMRLDLPSQFEVLLKGFPSNVRRRIRRAEREGMIVRFGRDELLDEFYQIFSKNMRDLGTPAYGRDFFSAVLKFFPLDARIVAISLKDRPLAAGLIYGFRDMLEIPWVSSDRCYNHLAANMLLYGCVLEHACKEGFRVFDFGRSSPDSGTFRFKQQWGAVPVPLYWYYWLASGEALPDLSPRNPRYELAIKMWKRLPLLVANQLGPLIAPSIP
jgi:FemAB-related protein (PEP-CTERM system-associated)